MNELKIFVCKDPTCPPFVVIAEHEWEARDLMDHELRRNGMSTWQDDPYKLTEIPLEKAAFMLDNGGLYLDIRNP